LAFTPIRKKSENLQRFFQTFNVPSNYDAYRKDAQGKINLPDKSKILAYLAHPAANNNGGKAMFKKLIMFGAVGLIAIAPLASFPAVRGGSDLSAASAVSRQRRFGPYATLRRANEVANYARRRGYRAKVIYGGSYIYNTRQYYVDVW
jgi:hypothetical protein